MAAVEALDLSVFRANELLSLVWFGCEQRRAYVRLTLPAENVVALDAGSRIRVSWEAGVTVVSVTGDLDLVHAAHLTEVVLRAVGTSGAVLVDLGACSFLDSSGLSALLTGLRAAKTAGVRYGVASAPGGAPRALFDLAFGRRLFASSDDRAMGLVALRGVV